VAMGNRSVGVNASVRVPSQRKLPAGRGERLTGTEATLSACEPSAIIGWLNAIKSSRAIGTSPAGVMRSTSSGPRAAEGRSVAGGGGNGCCARVAPCGTDGGVAWATSAEAAFGVTGSAGSVESSWSASASVTRSPTTLRALGAAKASAAARADAPARSSKRKASRGSLNATDRRGLTNGAGGSACSIRKTASDPVHASTHAASGRPRVRARIGRSSFY